MAKMAKSPTASRQRRRSSWRSSRTTRPILWPTWRGGGLGWGFWGCRVRLRGWEVQVSGFIALRVEGRGGLGEGFGCGLMASARWRMGLWKRGSPPRGCQWAVGLRARGFQVVPSLGSTSRDAQVDLSQLKFKDRDILQDWLYRRGPLCASGLRTFRQLTCWIVFHVFVPRPPFPHFPPVV